MNHGCAYYLFIIDVIVLKFITCLIENGNLGLARALRSQLIIKYEEIRTRLLPEFDLASMNSINRRCTLLNFKSSELAEQMTLLGSVEINSVFNMFSSLK